MKTRLKAILSIFALLLAGILPVSAVAENNAGGHSHTASYHDRTPVVHTHDSHGGHHRS